MTPAECQIFGQQFVAARLERRILALESALAATRDPARIRQLTHDIGQYRAWEAHVARVSRTTQIAHLQR